MKAIQAEPGLELHLIVAGAHLSAAFGRTEDNILSDGFPVADRVKMSPEADTPEALALSVGTGMQGFARSFGRVKPDLLVLVGDRLELFAAACAALPFRLPLAHISGGDVTEGAIDNQVRFAVTRLSHLHFVAMQAHADRLIGGGEETWRVHVTGDPALDFIRGMRFMDRPVLEAELGLTLKPPLLVISFHPTTLGVASVVEEVDALLSALTRLEGTLVFTFPNADAGSSVIIDKLKRFVASRPCAKLFNNLGQRKYYNLLAQADLMVGNSSSGIWESPSFHLPAVNVGERQRGRFRAPNVLDAEANPDAISQAVRRGLDTSFRAGLSGLSNPFGDGCAAARIVDELKKVDLGPDLLQKKMEAREPTLSDGGGGVLT
jgi:UDP-hydrolysing UDP-N-acetyl-D-glucosamine 2-epimerase